MKIVKRIGSIMIATLMVVIAITALLVDPIEAQPCIGDDFSSVRVASNATDIGSCDGKLAVVSESSVTPLTIQCSKLEAFGGLFSNSEIHATAGEKYVTPQDTTLYTYNIFQEVFDHAKDFVYRAGSYQTGGYIVSANDYAEENLNISAQQVHCGSFLGASDDITLSASLIQNQNLDIPTSILAVNGDIRINADKLNILGLIYAPNGVVEINANIIDFKGIIIANEVMIRGNVVSLKAQSLGLPIEMYTVGPENVFTGDIMQAGSSSSGSERYYYDTGGYGRDCAKYDKYKLLKTVKVGDIVYEAEGGGGFTGHIAVVHKFIIHPIYIYHGSSYAGSYTVRQIQLIEAIDVGVRYSILDDVRCDEKGVTILRSPLLTDSKWVTIRAFLEKQIGKDFSWFVGKAAPGLYIAINVLPKHTSIDTPSWYCSELVWAAYLSAGIDIEKSGWGQPGVTPHDIKNNTKLKQIDYK